MIQREMVEEILNKQVRPLLHSHGGEAELVSVQEGVVSIRLLGCCAGCPSADLGSRSFIEETLRAELPDIQRVELEHGVDPQLLAAARNILSGSARG